MSSPTRERRLTGIPSKRPRRRRRDVSSRSNQRGRRGDVLLVRAADHTFELAERRPDRGEVPGQNVVTERVLMTAELVGEGDGIAELEMKRGRVHARHGCNPDTARRRRRVRDERAGREARTRVAPSPNARRRATKRQASGTAMAVNAQRRDEPPRQGERPERPRGSFPPSRLPVSRAGMRSSALLRRPARRRDRLRRVVVRSTLGPRRVRRRAVIDDREDRCRRHSRRETPARAARPPPGRACASS